MQVRDTTRRVGSTVPPGSGSFHDSVNEEVAGWGPDGVGRTEEAHLKLRKPRHVAILRAAIIAHRARTSSGNDIGPAIAGLFLYPSRATAVQRPAGGNVASVGLIPRITVVGHVQHPYSDYKQQQE
jgi:hypothetical protein